MITLNTITKTTAALAAVALIATGPADAFAKSKRKKRGKKAKAAKVVAAEKPAEPAPKPPPPKPVTDISDDAVLAADTVAVQPVFMVGAQQDEAWQRTSDAIAARSVPKGAADTVSKLMINAPKAAAGGFGFAGHSSATDIRILHYGLAAGFVTALVKAGQSKKAAELASGLSAASGLLAQLSEATRKAAALMVSYGKGEANASKTPTGMILAASVRAGMVGIAQGPQRAHGYYVTGVWAGASVLVAMLGGSSVWADMGEPIAVLLDKDAAFGGSDRKLAAHVRAIAAELRAKKTDVRKVAAIVKQMRAVTADKPAAAPAAATKPEAAAPAAKK